MKKIKSRWKQRTNRRGNRTESEEIYRMKNKREQMPEIRVRIRIRRHGEAKRKEHEQRARTKNKSNQDDQNQEARRAEINKKIIRLTKCLKMMTITAILYTMRTIASVPLLMMTLAAK